MAEKTDFSARWKAMRPSKTLMFWSLIACVALTIFVGFKWGGWVTGGSAREMAEAAAMDARAKVAVAVCLERFAKASDSAAQLAKLEKTDSWMRGTYVEKAGWVTLAGSDEPVSDAGERCAEQILKTGSAEAAKTAQ